MNATIEVPAAKRDLSARLPEPAKAKLARLIAERDDLHALLQVPSRRIDKLREARNVAERRLADLESPSYRRERVEMYFVADSPHPVRRIAPDQRQLDEVRDEVARLKAEIQEADARREERREPWAAVAQLLQQIDAWIDRVPADISIKMHELGKPPSKPANVATAIGKVRDRLSDAFARLDAARSALIPIAEAKELARREVEALAAAATPNVNTLLEGQGRIVWPRAHHSVQVVSGLEGRTATAGSGFASLPDPLALAAWLDPEAMLARLARQIEEAGDDETALDAEARAKRIAELTDEILKIERDEEALLEIASNEGVEIMRRPDADPRAVLGLSDDMPAPEGN
jgi:hypothetical protein